MTNPAKQTQFYFKIERDEAMQEVAVTLPPGPAPDRDLWMQLLNRRHPLEFIAAEWLDMPDGCLRITIQLRTEDAIRLRDELLRAYRIYTELIDAPRDGFGVNKLCEN